MKFLMFPYQKKKKKKKKKGTIYAMVQYFYKARDMNLITSRLTAMTKSETYYFSFFGCPIKALVNEK